MRNIEKYTNDGFSIDKLADGRYKVFTCPTQHFYVYHLDELVPELFEIRIAQRKLAEREQSLYFRYIHDSLFDKHD